MEKGIIRDDKGYVSTIIFNRPEKKNALDADALFLFGDTVKEIEKENKTRVIILRGTGEKIFTSGVDLAGGKKEFNRTIEGLDYCLNCLMDYPLPVISMICGPAIGGGLDLAVISDFRIAADNARFGAPLVRLGRTYYYTAIERLTRLIGLAGSKEILLIGKLIDSAKALELGLVNRVVSLNKIESVTFNLASELAEKTAPIAVKVTKHTIRKIFETTRISSELASELHGLVEEINKSEDAAEGINAMLAKRKPVFKGR
ncbi:MAG: enoyl-CoA hydratase/isomerase family protein [Clostridiales bacterium]|nr:enoyl-CoA hydratase/isomerase family protein [Clostridiales bacterium]